MYTLRVQATPLWGVDWTTAPYKNTGTKSKSEIEQDRIFDGEPLTALEIRRDVLDPLKQDRNFYKTNPYDVMLKPDASGWRGSFAIKIIERFQEHGFVKGGSITGLENLLTHVVETHGLQERARHIQRRYSSEIRRLNDPRDTIERKMAIHKARGDRQEQLQEYRKIYERDFAPQIVAYDAAQENNKRVDRELRQEETQLIEDFWDAFSANLSEEWQRTNSNMTYHGIIEDSLLNELQGLSAEQKAQLKELGLTPHFFGEIKGVLAGCDPDSTVNNIIEELRDFRSEQGKLMALLAEIQNGHEEDLDKPQVEKEEEGTLLAATSKASSENFEPEGEPSATASTKENFFATREYLAQARLDPRFLTLENEEYFKKLFNVGEDAFPRTVQEFNALLEKMFQNVTDAGGKLPPNLSKVDEVIVKMPPPPIFTSEDGPDVQRNWQNQPVLIYNPQTGLFSEKTIGQTMLYNSDQFQAGSVKVSILDEASMMNGGIAGQNTTVVSVQNVSEDGQQLNYMWYAESVGPNGTKNHSIQNHSQSLEEIQRQIEQFNQTHDNNYQGD